MATPSSKYIGAGTPITVTGGVLVGPIGTALPTDTTTTPNTAFKPLGYVSEDGIASKGGRKVQQVQDWNADIIAQLQTEHAVRFAFTLYAVWDADVLREVFGEGNVAPTPPTRTTGSKITVTETGLVLPHRSWIFDMKNDNKKLRIVLPYAQVSQVTERPFISKDLAGFNITVEAFKNDAGIKAFRYFDDGNLAPAGHSHGNG